MGMVTRYIFSTPEGEARIRMKVSIVIPVYNERAFIEEVSLRVLAVPIDKEIIVVDGSIIGRYTPAA